MGNVGAIHVHHSLPSVACPGENSAWTDPIGEDLVDDVQEFFAELIEVSKDPIDYINREQYFVKDIEVTGPSPDDFRVKVIHDGAKWHKMVPQFKEDEEDFCKTWYECFADRNLLYFKSRQFDPTGEKCTWELHSMMHPNKEEKSFKCEVWAVDHEGTRRHGKFVAGLVEWLWVKPLLLCRFGQKVKVRSNIESYDSGGRVALTEPLDEFFTADQFFEALVNSLKKEATDWGCELDSKSDEEFTGTFSKEFPLPDSMVNKETGQTTWRYTCSRHVVVDSKGRQVVIHDRVYEELVLMGFYRVYEEPVRCEFWQVLPNGRRMGGGREGCTLRLKLLALISEAELREEVEALSSKDNFMF